MFLRFSLFLSKIFFSIPYAILNWMKYSFQYQEYLYWTDWIDKTVFRVEKISGREPTLVRPQLDAAMGITMVAENRQLGWNPCAADNGNCSHLCFFRLRNYTCGCPDEHSPSCKTGEYYRNLPPSEIFSSLILWWSFNSHWQR